MEKKTFIVIGSIVIIALLGAWFYLIFSKDSTPAVENDYELGAVGNEVTVPPEQNTISTTTTVATRAKLRQITTKPVAGFREIISDNTNTDAESPLPTVYWVEMGTGHIYASDLETKTENRISGTTVGDVNLAEISPTGDFVAFGKREYSKNYPLLVSKIDPSEESLSLREVTAKAEQFSISADGKHLLFANKTDYGLTGVAYNLTTQNRSDLFKIPFHEATIQWGGTINNPVYVYPKTSYMLDGFLLEINNGVTKRLPASGIGFSALANSQIVLYTSNEKNIPTSRIIDRKTNINHTLSLSLLPEKCVGTQAVPFLICALDRNTALSSQFPDTWYQGSLRFKDSLWFIRLEDDEVSWELLTDTTKNELNPTENSGREIDITNVQLGNSSRVVYFINKNDNTLWMYEL